MLKAKRDMVKIFEDPWENMQCQTHVDFYFICLLLLYNIWACEYYNF